MEPSEVGGTGGGSDNWDPFSILPTPEDGGGLGAPGFLP